MKHKRNIITWFYPFFVGVIAFNILRVITDLTKNESFWQGDKQSHIMELVFSILFCYIADMIWRRRLNNPDKYQSAVKEYLFIFAELFLLSALYLALGIWVGIFYAEDWLNCFLIFIAYNPLLMLYYTLIRSDAVNKKYQEKILQLEKVKVDQYQTELKFLKSQYHPHFLFNALNTIYFQINEENKKARQSISQLSDLLRYQLYDIEQKVTLEQEMNYLKTYIAFQQIRMSKKLVLTMYFSLDLKDQRIHPLLFQPLIENAFKYVGGEYNIDISMRLQNNKVLFKIENSVSELTDSKGKAHGVGLENLKRRLELLYSGKYTLEIHHDENAFIANLQIEIDNGNKVYNNG
ncbi:MAG: histidine kinase [Tannerellaceae bacterium]|jgi:sensor histidine kinase YesM|nr:histidine kinase [Tannerellaceae bacterium]